MIVTIDTDKKEIVIEKATVQEIYEYVAKFGLLEYTIISKQSLSWYTVYPTIPTYPTTDPVYKSYDWKITCTIPNKQPQLLNVKNGVIQPPDYSKGTDFDIDKHFKAYYNII